jgi:TRAP-type C4-dicarboxylate transport system substrate-binding protein
MKRLLAITLMVFMASIGFFGHFEQPALAAPIKLGAVSALPSMVDPFKPLSMWIEKVNKRSKGELIIEYKGGAEVVAPPDQAMAVKKGIIDISMTFAAIYEGLVPGVKAMVLSQVYPWEERENGAFALLQDVHAKAGLYYLGRGYFHPKPGGFFWIWSRPKIEKPADFAGKRIGGISPAANPFIQALGASPKVMDLSEAYTALERGVIDCFWIAFTDIVPTGLAKVLPYCIDHGWYSDNNTFIINMKVWNRLPKNLQKVMTDSMIEVERETVKVSEGVFGGHRKGMLDAGMTFIKFSPADAKKYLDTAYNAGWADVKGKYPEIGAKLEKLISR